MRKTFLGENDKELFVVHCIECGTEIDEGEMRYISLSQKVFAETPCYENLIKNSPVFWKACLIIIDFAKDLDAF